MENLVVDQAFWRNKRVFLTGHTGFKGGWLALWLQKMDAQVVGFALEPVTQPNLFEVADVANGMQSVIGDITEFETLRRCFLQARPEIVIHMAGQPLVRYAYRNPRETYQTNVMGSLHVLECIRESKTVKAVVIVTTDKCYDNREWPWPYREHDALGGFDPYSSSKACVELMTTSYRNSYFTCDGMAAIATVRAGNVIGGGDWSEDRLFPDLVRAVASKETISVRNPNAIRPWQHVLEPLSGYMRLAEHLFLHGQAYAEAWNFGPGPDEAQNVRWIIEQVAGYWPELNWTVDSAPQPHEAHTLKLDCSKAYHRLGWHGRWPLSKAIKQTIEWYQQNMRGSDMKQFCFRQIDDYFSGGEA